MVECNILIDEMRCADMDYSSRQRFDEISKLRFDGNLAGAIELCQNAISAYPNDNCRYSRYLCNESKPC